MNSFNDGIEAAAKRLREISHEGLKDSWWRERFESAARSVEALKRPEPSEMDKVSSGAKVVLDWFQGDECTHVLSAVTLSELRALAALKAMEGE